VKCCRETGVILFLVLAHEEPRMCTSARGAGASQGTDGDDAEVAESNELLG
jgi:hypothetical protein